MRLLDDKPEPTLCESCGQIAFAQRAIELVDTGPLQGDFDFKRKIVFVEHAAPCGKPCKPNPSNVNASHEHVRGLWGHTAKGCRA